MVRSGRRFDLRPKPSHPMPFGAGMSSHAAALNAFLEVGRRVRALEKHLAILNAARSMTCTTTASICTSRCVMHSSGRSWGNEVVLACVTTRNRGTCDRAHHTTPPTLTISWEDPWAGNREKLTNPSRERRCLLSEAGAEGREIMRVRSVEQGRVSITRDAPQRLGRTSGSVQGREADVP